MNFFSWGLPLGRVAGIDVRIHWTLFALWVVRFNDHVMGAAQEYRLLAFAAWAVLVVLVTLSILLHELGHCFSARAVGGRADDVLLWPLGGLAFCECPETWKAHLKVAAGGPLVSLAIAVFSYLGFLAVERFFPLLPATSVFVALVYSVAYQVLVTWNLMILVFNLIPLYPLDGGRILHAGLWWFFDRKNRYFWGRGRARANAIALYVSWAVAVIGIAYSWHQRDFFLAFLFFWALMGAESLRDDR